LFYSIVWPHRTFVLRSARLLSNANDAEDLAQETLMRAYAALPTFQLSPDGSGVKAWLLRILRNLHTDRLRAASVRIAPGSLEDDLPAPSPATYASATDHDSLLDSFSDQTIIDALQSLPTDIRWTLLLTDVEGLDHSQAADILEIPVGTVKSRAFRGRSMLRSRLASLKPVSLPGGPR
jgi:RNA polymerase sigma-70 factor (ECF subfamily)